MFPKISLREIKKIYNGLSVLEVHSLMSIGGTVPRFTENRNNRMIEAKKLTPPYIRSGGGDLTKEKR